MPRWSTLDGHSVSMSTWWSKKVKNHEKYRTTEQKPEDVIFFTRVNDHFLRARCVLPALADKEKCRESVFQGDTRKMASTLAIAAYEMCVESFYERKEEHEWQDGDHFADDGVTILDDNDEPYVDMNSSSRPRQPFNIEDKPQVLSMCCKFDRCYPMFAGNHFGTPAENSGGLNPRLYCPFGKYCKSWRDDELGQDFALHTTFVRCDRHFDSHKDLMVHLSNAGSSCPCHEAAYAFMEFMYTDSHWRHMLRLSVQKSYQKYNRLVNDFGTRESEPDTKNEPCYVKKQEFVSILGKSTAPESTGPVKSLPMKDQGACHISAAISPSPDKSRFSRIKNASYHSTGDEGTLSGNTGFEKNTEFEADPKKGTARRLYEANVQYDWNRPYICRKSVVESDKYAEDVCRRNMEYQRSMGRRVFDWNYPYIMRDCILNSKKYAEDARRRNIENQKHLGAGVAPAECSVGWSRHNSTGPPVNHGPTASESPKIGDDSPPLYKRCKRN